MSTDKATPLRFNLNEYVRVKLTDRGRKLHREDNEQFWATVKMNTPPVYVPPVEDDEGWSTWQLWSLMEAFGSHTTIGSNLCFETTIELVGVNHFDEVVAALEDARGWLDDSIDNEALLATITRVDAALAAAGKG